MPLSARLRSALSAVRVLALWDALHSSFWFLPAIMAAVAIGLSFGLVRLDDALGEGVYRKLAWIYLFGPDGARAILSAIAGSMITVAALTFSITMLTLQMSSSQFGPRLMRNYMRDRGNQVVLGTFIATFLYCLLVMRTIRASDQDSGYVPHVAVAAGVVLAMASLAVLIYFIHHTAHSIRIETQLAALTTETRQGIDRLYPEPIGRGTEVRAVPPTDDGPATRALRASRSGYVQYVDGDRLMALACEHDIAVRLTVRPGAFVAEDDVVMTASPGDHLDDEKVRGLVGTLVLGDERTAAQDLEFSLRRIVELAQRALSPGMNDPTTALYCIDRLSEAFARVTLREIPSAERLDDEGLPRVLAEMVAVEDMACAAFAAVARYGSTDADVVRGLTAALSRVIGVARAEDRQKLGQLREAILRESQAHGRFEVGAKTMDRHPGPAAAG